ncbi:MAG TPA: sigma factor, partial [Polyangiaceae bacterium]
MPPPRPPPDLGNVLAALRPAVRALLGHVLAVPPGHPDVDDCESEVYRRAVEGHGRVDPGLPLKPWLLGIARHVALDAHRARRRTARRAGGESADEEGDPMVERVPDVSP